MIIANSPELHTPLFRVCVLDTAGNEIMKFGDYGDENCMGPEGPVADPRTNRLRLRREDPRAKRLPPSNRPQARGRPR